MSSVFRSNIETLGVVWKQQWLAEGRAEGLTEGLAEGEANGVVTGTAHALVCLLEARFGALTRPQHEQISTADLATLDDWFKHVIAAPGLPPSSSGRVETAAENPMDPLLEVTNELVRLGEIWKCHCRAVGRAEGLAESRAKGWGKAFGKGLAQSWADSLVLLLAERFGQVPPDVREQISKAKVTTVKRWFKRAVAASDLPSVFAHRTQCSGGSAWAEHS